MDDNLDLREEVVRYLSFWPFLLVLVIVFLASSFLYLRYATFQYESAATIEILDESQEREMALPSELTVFNRSMINLENEINVLNSYLLHSRVVKNLNSNILFYTVGNIKTSQRSKDKWFKDYDIDFKIDTHLVDIQLSFDIEISNGNLIIKETYLDGNHGPEKIFSGLTTKDSSHDFPFEITINNYDDSSKRNLKILTIDETAKYYKNITYPTPLGNDSDQLEIKIIDENFEVTEEYLNGILTAFDNDGIVDRQLEYKRTIEFVDEREIILKKELEVIELKKQKFKQLNNLSDLTIDAGNNIDLKLNYNSELFDVESQKSLANYLLESLISSKYDYLPINIGLDNFDLNQTIVNYNEIVTERNKYFSEAGPNNILVKSLDLQLDNLILNISSSIENYINSVDLKINDLKEKELEFDNLYNSVPENEKILRSIERELTIKEALYLLLLQKREEAAINLAVVKPTVKVIEYPLTNESPVSPKPLSIYFGAIVSSILLYFGTIYIWFFMDNKIHTRDGLLKFTKNKIPILTEVPNINKEDTAKVYSSSSREPLHESIRMLLANLSLTITDKDNQNGKSIMVTSSVKGEGKTIISINLAYAMVSKYKKVILVGSDLRNPQIHKFIGVKKSVKGISNYISSNDNNWKDYVKNYDGLDVMLSGVIPPNPTAILSSKKYIELLNELKRNYEYIIIDSAPCLLVSDTFEISKNIDTTLYVVRSNYSSIELCKFINECFDENKLRGLNLILNGVGNSSAYGYKYGYQYGYRYGYKYSYNYGYGYGYSEENS